MIIQKMFQREIDRQVNGVIKVEQIDEANLRQELEEYVITRELRRHFQSFLDNYSSAITRPTDKIGVWISGFYGSGKSHFLKILSYLLSNKTVDGKKAVEFFRDKFDGADAMLYASLVRCCGMLTESILFQIDNVHKGEKNETAVRRILAQEFYNHLGFYGADLKIAKLEKHISKQGKTDEFRTEFKKINGAQWEESRSSYAFFEDDIVAVLKNVLGMSEAAARNWFNADMVVELSIKELVAEICEYVDGKGKDFRLLLCIDEVGQFIGENSSLMLNLQSFVEEIGDKCRGKVWVMVTSQEAIDNVIKVKGDDFSKQMARWDTKLSLSSSSVDEVIKKRILLKNQDADKLLKLVYDSQQSVLKNLFTFNNSVSDIKGYGSSEEFAATFPFVPYQFIILQKTFTEIRKHGFSIKHLSSGERSMLSGFKDAAVKVMNKDENTLVPFYLFYDTVHTVLDSTIRRVIERAQAAAEKNEGIAEYDVSVLKLLYLIRYIDDIKANLDNIAVLMVDDIRCDKIEMRARIADSLKRLESQNYISRDGDTYRFLTDEEQDIAKDIKNTQVDSASITKTISEMIFADIYQSKKILCAKTPFSYDQYIDETVIGSTGSGIRLQFVTAMGDRANASKEQLIMESKINCAAIIVLEKNTSYYEALEQSAKINKYIKQKNVGQLPENTQSIIRGKQQQARFLIDGAKAQIAKSITDGTFYIHGEKIEIKYTDPKLALDAALKQLVEGVYSKLNFVNTFIDSDADVLKILSGATEQSGFMGTGANNEFALNEIGQWLEAQQQTHIPVSMADVQKRYQSIPYGWREIDIAGLMARLVVMQKIDIRYGGVVVGRDDRRLVDFLRRKSEIDKASVTRRIAPSEDLKRKCITFLRDWLNVMDVPDDDDSLIDYIKNVVKSKQEAYEKLLTEYAHARYPEREIVENARNLTNDILSQKSDNIALLTRLFDRQDKLRNMTEDMEQIETFFKSQRVIFDSARMLLNDLQDDRDCFTSDTETKFKIDEMHNILASHKPYNKIKDLTELMQSVRAAHAVLLQQKKDEVLSMITQCMGDIHTLAGHSGKAKDEIIRSDNEFTARKQQIAAATSLTVLDAMIARLLNYKDSICKAIEVKLRPVSISTNVGGSASANIKPPQIAQVRRYEVFPVKRLETAEEIDTYLDELRKKLLSILKDNDGIQIN